MTLHPTSNATPTSRRSRIRPVHRLVTITAIIVTVLLAVPQPASAHPLSTSTVVLELGTHRVRATVELPLDQLGVAMKRSYTSSSVTDATTLAGLRAYVGAHLSATDSADGSWITNVAGGQVEKIDGADNLVLDATLTPSSGRVGDFVLHYDAIIDRLASHRAFVTARHGDTGAFTTLVMLSWQRTTVPVASTGTGTGVSIGSMMRLGMRHIAGGYDHLLFLTMLLLPVPLLVRRRGVHGIRGGASTARRVALIATCFTLGHSITLALVSFRVLHLPARPVETLVAVSIAVAALHAIKPLVSRGEAFIAAGFGLVHGGAFATTILELHLDNLDTLKAVFGFNLGIEAAQLIVIATVVPVLYVASANRGYRYLLVCAASASILVTADWVQAIWRNTTPHVDAAFKVLADHPYATWIVLAALAAVLWVVRVDPPPPVSRTPVATPQKVSS